MLAAPLCGTRIADDVPAIFVPHGVWVMMLTNLFCLFFVGRFNFVRRCQSTSANYRQLFNYVRQQTPSIKLTPRLLIHGQLNDSDNYDDYAAIEP